MAGLNLGRAWMGVIALLAAVPGLAPTRADVDTALIADDWREMTFDGKTPNSFARGGSDAIEVVSRESVSLLQKSIDVDLEATPILNWRWQVSQPAPATDLGIKGADDRSLAVYVAFPFVPEEASLWERFKRGLVEQVAGKDAPGRVLVYVFGGQGQRGDAIASPHLGEAGRLIILRPTDSASDHWYRESVDVAEDYRLSFGSEPPDPMSLAISADTDDTGSTARGLIADLDFTSTALQ